MPLAHPESAQTDIATIAESVVRPAACLPVEPAAAVARGSRRLRLWDLDPAAHCPVVGVCVPLPTLRRLFDRAKSQPTPDDDYDLHVHAVQACRRRTPLAEALQRDLDQRYAAELRRGSGLREERAIADAWCEAFALAHWPGHFWALLTHPRASAELRLRLLNDVHMRQHQLGAAQRGEQSRLHMLQGACDRQRADHEALQQRYQAAIAAAARREEALQAQLVRLRAESVVRETLLQAARDELHALHAQLPGLPRRAELASQLRQQGECIAAQQREITGLRDEVQRHRQRAASLASARQAETAPVAPVPVIPAPALADRAVLCVGGRTSSVPLYRALVEGIGGRFLHHDGGTEHSADRLGATLAAADVVICQAGCVSHDAYRRVKEHCKRHGKRCVFVDNPGSATWKRAIDRLCA